MVVQDDPRGDTCHAVAVVDNRDRDGGNAAVVEEDIDHRSGVEVAEDSRGIDGAVEGCKNGRGRGGDGDFGNGTDGGEERGNKTDYDYGGDDGVGSRREDSWVLVETEGVTGRGCCG